ncbi:MAG: patatin-like phospholipase family protein [Deltaproteobacteria bacterium]|nr:patatin-like phospholipase family protein [Deltaproteobacteria bacterium]MDH3383178.1 patatin-like phospholipase family protein [Deltaproteobacteria bacterium]
MEITLALSGGGSKGFAHIGVLRALGREGVHVRAVAGTSMGGLIGCLFAAGYPPDEIETLMAPLARHPPFDRTRGEGPAMKGLAGVSDALTEALGDRTFEDLSIPFAVTAVDMETAELLALRQGPVREAVLATIAVPGVFPVMKRNGRSLVDGSVLDPVPVALARILAPHLPVVAVTLSPPVDSWVRRPTPRVLASLPFLGKYLARSRWAQALNIFLGSLDISGALISDLRLQLDRPDAIIRPQVHQIGLLDPVEIRDVASLGEQAAEEAFPQIQRLETLPDAMTRRLRRWFSPEETSRYGT